MYYSKWITYLRVGRNRMITEAELHKLDDRGCELIHPAVKQQYANWIKKLELHKHTWHTRSLAENQEAHRYLMSGLNNAFSALQYLEDRL